MSRKALAILSSIILIGGIVFAFAMLWLADRYASAYTFCPTNPFLEWLGCAMAAHDALAGGIIGALVALCAAVLAFVAVQFQIGQQKQDELDRHERELASIKTAIYAEIADRSARCVNDYLDPWRSKEIVEPSDLICMRVEIYLPIQSVIFPAVAAKVGLIESEALLAITQFYFQLDALSQAFRSVADDMANREAAFGVPDDWLERDRDRVKIIKDRLSSCCVPALSALDWLIPEAEAREFDKKIVEVFSPLRHSKLTLRAALRAIIDERVSGKESTIIQHAVQAIQAASQH
jgi:hypothetical protein